MNRHLRKQPTRNQCRSRLSSLNSLSSHIFARAFIPLLRAKGKMVRLHSGQIEEDEHEENEESLTEGEEPAEDR